MLAMATVRASGACAGRRALGVVRAAAVRRSGGTLEAEEGTGEAGYREKLVANMGHTDFKTFKRYYENARSRAEAKEYWSIRPPMESQAA
jgi:hypothetical protein